MKKTKSIQISEKAYEILIEKLSEKSKKERKIVPIWEVVDEILEI